MPKTISIATQKGGSAKTTTTINLGAALVNLGFSVLLIDTDPQASLSVALGIKEEQAFNLFTEVSKEIKGENGNLNLAICTTDSGIKVIPSTIDLAWAELELVSVYGREQIFTWLLDKLETKFDFILFDCPPSVGMLTVNALVASDYVLLPLQAEFLPKKAVGSFMHHLKILKKLNKKLEVLGIVLNRYDERKRINKQILQELKDDYKDQVFDTHIRTNIALVKAQEAGKDIFCYDKTSNGAEDYALLAEEFIQKLKLK
jgi:chromosome partitioning protein